MMVSDPEAEGVLRSWTGKKGHLSRSEVSWFILDLTKERKGLASSYTGTLMAAENIHKAHSTGRSLDN